MEYLNHFHFHNTSSLFLVCLLAFEIAIFQKPPENTTINVMR